MDNVFTDKLESITIYLKDAFLMISDSNSFESLSQCVEDICVKLDGMIEVVKSMLGDENIIDVNEKIIEPFDQFKEYWLSVKKENLNKGAI
jgi:hypothetical protein